MTTAVNESTTEAHETHAKRDGTANTPAFLIRGARSMLQEALVRATAASAKKSTLPVLTAALIEVNGGALEQPGQVRITTTDLDQRLETSFAATVCGAGTVALPARRLLDIVSSLPSAATVSIEVKGTKARVTCGRSKFDLLGFAADEFPRGETFKATIENVSIDAKAFLDGIARVAACASTASSRPTFCGALLESADDGLFLVACDGFRLARIRVADPSEFRSECIIRRESFASIRSTFANDTTLSLTASQYQLRLAGKDSVLTSRLIEGPYSNYRMLISRAPTRTVVLNAELFTAAVKRVSLVTAGDRDPINLTFRPSDVLVVAQSPDEGRAEDVVECRYTLVPELVDGKDANTRIAIDARYLTSVIESIGADDKGEIALQITSPTVPLYVRQASTPESMTLGIAMPLRLKGEVDDG